MKKRLFLPCVLVCVALLSACSGGKTQAETVPLTSQPAETAQAETEDIQEETTVLNGRPLTAEVKFKAEYEYADYSVIHTDSATLFYSQADVLKHKVICINAGHGCKGGSSVKTLCHPDGTPKVTGGSTPKGAVKATSINEGMTFLDGTSEADANLELAKVVKRVLLDNGYDVLMLRESSNAQLDNIARTVIANNNADCHISLHYDSTKSDKGLFYLSVPDVASYRNMEPVKSHYREHLRLGDALIEGEKAAGVKIFSGGSMETDLTQTSYSTIPSVDLEVGDRASAHTEAQHKQIADGILKGLEIYFKS